MVNTLRTDPETSEEEHFKLMLVQTEMERVKFLVRSYVRTRLHKVGHCLGGKGFVLTQYRLRSMPIISSSHQQYTLCSRARSCPTLNGTPGPLTLKALQLIRGQVLRATAYSLSTLGSGIITRMAAADGRHLWRRLEHGYVMMPARRVADKCGSLGTEQECAGADILPEGLWRDHTGGVSARWTVGEVKTDGV